MILIEATYASNQVTKDTQVQRYRRQSSFSEGYAIAILDSFFDSDQPKCSFDNGKIIVYLPTSYKNAFDEDKLIRNLKRNTSIKNVSIIYKNNSRTADNHKPCIVQENRTRHNDINTLKTSELSHEVFPSKPLLAPLVADPRWPRFSVGLQNHFQKNYGKTIYTFSFGENIPVYRATKNEITYEIGVQAGLFGIMDLSYKSPTTGETTRLLNSDYTVGLGLTINTKNFQHFIQYSHLSAHLGDELLVSQPNLLQQRINLSYETIKFMTTLKLNQWRPYASLSYMIRKEPSFIKPFIFEYGFDYRHDKTYFQNLLRPIFGIHMHHWQQNDYKPTMSIVGGVQFENSLWETQNIELVMEYSNGQSRHGQLFDNKTHYLGLTLRLSR